MTFHVVTLTQADVCIYLRVYISSVRVCVHCANIIGLNYYKLKIKQKQSS